MQPSVTGESSKVQEAAKQEETTGGTSQVLALPAKGRSRHIHVKAWVCGIVTILVSITAIALAVWAAASPIGPPKPKPLKCDKASFTPILPSGATLEQVTAVPEGGSFGEGAANIPYPTNPTDLPELCALTVRVVSSPTSFYRFGLFLPAAWQGRFLAVGNGGFAGGINWLDMAPGAHYGMATVSSDLGHNSSVTGLSWALNQPEMRTDWGWRALHGTIVLGKQLSSAYYGKSIAHSYYNGCSTGGRQGLKEIQNFPDSFDGALIGAPAWWTSHLNNDVTRVGIYNLPVSDPKHIPTPLFSVIADEVVRQCDSADGVTDGIVTSPELCTFDFSPLLCGPFSNTSACLTQAQIATAKKVYNDAISTADGSLVYPGLTLSSEDQWYILLGGATDPSPFGVGYERNFLLNDANWDWRKYNDSLIKLAEQTDPGNSTAAKFDIHPYKDRGGKIFMYHGVADGLVPTKGSEYYYNKTIEAFGGKLDDVTDFFRFFLIPGMQHCWSTPVNAPYNIAGAFQAGAMGSGQWSVPGFKDKDHDAVLAMVEWVEHGKPIDQIVASTWRSPLNASSGLSGQRPLCPWPLKATYNGAGEVSAASSWSCPKLSGGGIRLKKPWWSWW
ncbi:tannase and feruloyl esterase-domain-containing protein [Podospora didyma]|uniref:Carboxylic ester hydrolase n=1 Tax=Podospora didyma TaxID=330526 RepID=A0AAE0NP26_9PEZI|nr:tannase and feruloyl esterase-domain-containing protein [Podospora didyma]